MIVCCERCDTRFKLDESRIPARGARVRCSRCKHAFFVTPPGVAPEEQVHAVAAEAARAPAAKPRAPEPSWDLGDSPDATVVSTRKAPAGAPSLGSEDDSDWRFEDDLPGLDPGATRSSSLDLGGAQTAPSLVVPPDPNEDSLAELGDPETWDLLAGDAPGTGSPPPAAPPPEPEPLAPVIAPAPVAARPVEPAPAPPAPVVAPAPRVAAAAPPLVVAEPPARPAATRPRVVRPSPGGWAGWAALAVLGALTLFGVVRSPAPEARGIPPVNGFELAKARVRTVENAAAGPILVVSGELRNAGSAPRTLGAPLVVQLLDADGAPLAGATASLGPALPEARVREEAPETLRAAQEAAATTLARAPVAGGAALAFDAVFTRAPREAARFAVTPAGR